jgi:stearoyl-CoA desaturase (delta-9 desaturase)
MERTRNMEPFSFAEAYRTCARHYKEGNLNWPMIIYISLAHVAALFGIFSLQYCAKYTLLWAFICWPISGLGITAGAHRLWAHRSYKATFALRTFLMLANSMVNQGSIWHWSRDHRVHHKHSESSADPHDATRGMFFAHMGWLFVKKHPAVVEAGKTLSFDDLKADPLVVFQKTCDPWFALFMCFVFPGLVCMLWGDNFWNGYLVAGALSYVMVLHFTWLVNSWAHFFGDHPYDPASWPAENPVVSVLALGEGWHNWHHKYPFDYATSEFGVTKQYNPTKFFIDTCCLLGLASERKRATGAWSKLKAQRQVEIDGAVAELKKTK